jgi:hypothetical protein
MVINVRKADSVIVDVNQVYDTRFFDNVTVPDGTLVGLSRTDRYIWNGTAVVKVGENDRELAERVIAAINNATTIAQLKAILIEIVKAVFRRLR